MTITSAALFALMLGNFIFALLFYRRHVYSIKRNKKGNHANVGVIAYTDQGYMFLKEHLTENVVQKYFKALGVQAIKRYELPNLQAFNFLLYGILNGGGSRSLRIDAQGKALGQALLQMTFEVDEEDLSHMVSKQ